MKSIRILLALLAVMLFSMDGRAQDAPAGYLNGTPIDVSDGDTMKMEAGGVLRTVRFFGVDCPEKEWTGKWPAQPRWQEARDFVRALVMGKTVTVKLSGDSTYERYVGEVYVDGKSVTRELVRNGLGWWYANYAGDDLDLMRLESEAHAAGRGLWQDPQPVEPWTWRRMEHGDSPAPLNAGPIAQEYYEGTEGLSGDALREALHEIISDQEVLSYKDCWTALMYTDEDPANPNHVILLYTGWSIPKEEHGTGKDQWNREHVWAKSRGDFGTTMGPGTDIHHLRPADVTVNSSRNNRAFDNGGQPDLDDGRETGCNMDSNSWEPRDADKGDVARMMFYMDVRYEDSPDLKLVQGEENGKKPLHGKLSALLEWHRQDPVDDFERRRNERIFELQRNRNPFIDYPGFVDLIWGNN